MLGAYGSWQNFNYIGNKYFFAKISPLEISQFTLAFTYWFPMLLECFLPFIFSSIFFISRKLI